MKLEHAAVTIGALLVVLGGVVVSHKNLSDQIKQVKMEVTTQKVVILTPSPTATPSATPTVVLRRIPLK